MPLDSTVIYLGTAAYGRLATVIAHRLKTRTLDIRLGPVAEFTQLGMDAIATAPNERYFSGAEAARRVHLPASVLSRLTGMLQINCERAGRDGGRRSERVNVGVTLKVHSKMLKVPSPAVPARPVAA